MASFLNAGFRATRCAARVGCASLLFLALSGCDLGGGDHASAKRVLSPSDTLRFEAIRSELLEWNSKCLAAAAQDPDYDPLQLPASSGMLRLLRIIAEEVAKRVEWLEPYPLPEQPMSARFDAYHLPDAVLHSLDSMGRWPHLPSDEQRGRMRELVEKVAAVDSSTTVGASWDLLVDGLHALSGWRHEEASLKATKRTLSAFVRNVAPLGLVAPIYSDVALDGRFLAALRSLPVYPIQVAFSLQVDGSRTLLPWNFFRHDGTHAMAMAKNDAYWMAQDSSLGGFAKRQTPRQAAPLNGNWHGGCSPVHHRDWMAQCWPDAVALESGGATEATRSPPLVSFAEFSEIVMHRSATWLELLNHLDPRRISRSDAEPPTLAADDSLAHLLHTLAVGVHMMPSDSACAGVAEEVKSHAPQLYGPTTVFSIEGRDRRPRYDFAVITLRPESAGENQSAQSRLLWPDGTPLFP